jgi:redox-sensitive bicupin YhaK (pirin superfamily)
MIIRRSRERGFADHGWLRSFHTFSFAGYYDPDHMGFRALRVINDDRVEPGQGFGAHEHHDMEIITYVLEGELTHKDSMGNGAIIGSGEVQLMSAGTGVVHSEFNASRERPVHFLQIWIIPEQRGLPPRYQQRVFPREERRGKWRLIVSHNGRDGSLGIHQDVNLYAGFFNPTQTDYYEILAGRYAWLHVASGSIKVDSTPLQAGDAAAFLEGGEIKLVGHETAEVLLFDLA